MRVKEQTTRPSLWALAGYGALALVLRARPDNRPATGYRRTEPPLPTGFPQREGPPPGGAALQRDEKPAEHVAPPDPSWWGITKGAVNQWVAHKDARLGAALAYYSVFSLGPLIVIAIAVAGLLFGQEAVRGEVAGGLKGLLGETGAQAIEAMLAAASRPNEGMLATVIGIATLVFAAVGVVVQLKDALNTVWEVEPPPGKGIWGFARTYVLSLAGVLSLGFLLLVSMLMTTALSAVGKYISPYLARNQPCK